MNIVKILDTYYLDTYYLEIGIFRAEIRSQKIWTIFR